MATTTFSVVNTSRANKRFLIVRSSLRPNEHIPIAETFNEFAAREITDALNQCIKLREEAQESAKRSKPPANRNTKNKRG